MDDVTEAEYRTLCDEMSEEGFFVPVPAESLTALNPFGDQSCVYVDTSREINVAQLTDEIGELVGFEVQLIVINPRPGTPVSRENLARLYVCPEVESEVIAKAVSLHKINETYGLTRDRVLRQELIEKLREDDLTPGEMREALRLVLESG